MGELDRANPPRRGWLKENTGQLFTSDSFVTSRLPPFMAPSQALVSPYVIHIRMEISCKNVIAAVN